MSEYPYIRAWGKMLHSYDYYITQQVNEARADKAAHDAIYKSQDGKWKVFEDIQDLKTRVHVKALVIIAEEKNDKT